MRRFIIHAVIALVTFTAGSSAARLWHGDTPDYETPPPAIREERTPYVYAPRTLTAREIAEQEILDIIRRTDVALTKHDVAFFKELEAESYVSTDEDGETMTRAQAIAEMLTWDKRETFTSDDVQVEFYGNAAMVTGRTTTRDAEGYEYEARWIDLYQKRDGRWRLLSTTAVD